MSTAVPSFLMPPPLTGFDIYRQDPFAEIVVKLCGDLSSKISGPEDVRNYLDAYVDDSEVTEAQSNDLYQMIVGGLPLSSVEGGSFPRELFIGDGLIGGITDWIVSNANRRQPEMALFHSIAIVGTVIARRVKTLNGDHPNTYHLLTCPSGGGKDGPRQATFRLMDHAGGSKLIGTESVTSATAIISQLRESPALLFPIDEAGKVVTAAKRQNASNPETEVETVFLKLWSSADNPSFRHKGFAKIEDNVEIVCPNVSLVGTSTPETLYGQGGLDRTSVIDGFLSRCILFDTGEKVPPLCTPVRTPPPASIVDPLAAWINFEPAGEFGWKFDPQPKIATFDADADAERAIKAATVRWDILAERLPAEHGASLYRRCPEKARKYALIYAASERTPEDEIVIERRHADWGVSAISWLADHSLWIVKDKVSASSREQKMARILAFIDSRKNKGATKSDLSNRFRDIPRKDRNDLILDLIESGDVEGETADTGGRPKGTLYSRTHATKKPSSSNTELSV